MSRFQFRLDRLLDLRQAVERERAAQLHAATQQEEAARRALEEHDRRCAAARAAPGALGAEMSVAGMIRNYGLVLEAAIQAAETQRTLAEEASRRRVEEQERFTTARTDRRSLERLRESAVEQWNRDEQRAEQRAVDEVASRRGRSGGRS